MTSTDSIQPHGAPETMLPTEPIIPTRHTAQSIYDTVLAHLRTQGEHAYESGRCAYRTRSGQKCAVGCLIPDDVYTPEIEGNAVSAAPKAAVDLFDALEVCGLLPFKDLLSDLQHAHDADLRKYGLPGFETAMERVARMHRLAYSPPSEAHA